MRELRGRGLSVREMAVLLARYGLALDGSVAAPPLTLVEVGRELRVTPERVRQIETQALRRLRAEAGLPDHDDWWRGVVGHAVARAAATPPRAIVEPSWAIPLDTYAQRVIDARYPKDGTDGPAGAGTAE